MSRLTHLNERGEAHMVDVSGKDETVRVARARGTIAMTDKTKALLFGGGLSKGDALAVARVAAIAGTKRCADLIPLCHPLPLHRVAVEIEPIDGGAEVIVEAKTAGKTGVEMEAMTGCSVGLLTIYDMIKGVERGARIGGIELLHKSGGKSGTWDR